MTDNSVLALTQALIERPSVTPEDGGCQSLIAKLLRESGFSITALPFAEVSNLWARHGTGSPLFVFAGHTDVVPAGDIDAWDSPPFIPTERNGYLYGRGAADMKSGLAAMLLAAKRFITDCPKYHGSIAFLITSDEEGDAVHGTRQVIEHLLEEGVTLDYCIIGEASSSRRLGDAIRIGRRGSLSGRLTITGVQGHVAYPELVVNPIHNCLAPLSRLCEFQWDKGNEAFPPTSFQISNIHAGTGATNVVPGEVCIDFNIRFCPIWNAYSLKRRVEALLNEGPLDYEIAWKTVSDPFYTQPGALSQATEQAIKKVTGLTTKASTGGGTSDGRFIAKSGAEVIELGPINETIHKVNERIKIADLEPLAEIYYRILRNIFVA